MNILQDLRYALRRLASTPLFTGFAVVSLALGIGATTSIYSAAYELVLRPAVMGNPDTVVDIYNREPLEGSGYVYPEQRFSIPDFEDLHAQQTRFSRMSAWTGWGGPITTAERAEVVQGEAVDGEFFSVVGVGASLGRLIQTIDNDPGAPDVVVISYAFWERWFGGDPTVIGRRLRIREKTFEIVGVAEPEFRGVRNPNLQPSAFWVPLMPSLRASTDSLRLNHRNSALLNVKAQMKPGVTMDAARADVKRVAGIVDGKAPVVWDRSIAERRLLGPRQWFVAANLNRFSTGDTFSVSLVAVLMGAVGLVLLVACTNLANLMLARVSRRRYEFAVRMALGASRWRLIREQIVEGGVVAVAGGALAIVTAWLAMQWIHGSAQLFGSFVFLNPRFNGSVAAVAILATLLTMFVFSLLPALQTTRTRVDAAIRADGANMSMRWRGRRLLITAQVVVSTVLITTAFLAAQQLHSVANRDLGLDLNNIAAVSMDFDYSHYDQTRARSALDAGIDKARRLPGIEKAAVATGFPLGPDGSARLINGPQTKDVGLIAGTPEMFAVFGVRLKRGRFFDENDSAANSPVAVVSEGVVSRLFPTGDALGRQVTLKSGYSIDPRPDEVVTIVGVVAEPNAAAVGRRSNGYAFRPWAQRYDPRPYIVARTNDPAAQLEALTRVIRETGRDIVISYRFTGPGVVLMSNLAPRIVGTVAGILGCFALILSLIGLYGVLGHIVAGRTREVGVRIALGADRRQIMRMILLQGLEPVISGLVLGLILGAAARSAFQPLIVQVFPAFDPLVFVLVPLPFAVAASIACYIPARRASRVDPLVALRDL